MDTTNKTKTAPSETSAWSQSTAIPLILNLSRGSGGAAQSDEVRSLVRRK